MKEESSPVRRCSMTNGVRVDIEGQFNPNNIFESCNSCFVLRRLKKRGQTRSPPITKSSGSKTMSSTSTSTDTGTFNRGLYIDREQLDKELQEENWTAFCNDLDLEMSRLEKIKLIYYPLSGLMAFLFLLVVCVPILLLWNVLFAAEKSGFNLGYYIGWLGTMAIVTM